MIKILIPQSAHLNQFKIQHSAGYLISLKKINLFIGENNSGKSKFIRSLITERWKNNHLRFVDETGETNLLKEYTASYKEQLVSSLQTLLDRFTLLNSVSFTNLLHDLKHIEERSDKITVYIKAAKIFESAKPENLVDIEQARNPVLDNLFRRMNDYGTKMIRLISSNLGSNENFGDMLYLPILRGLRPIHASIEQNKKPKFDSTDDYKLRTTHDYFDDGTNRSNSIQERIFSGLEMYEAVTRLLLGTVEERRTISSFEDFISRIVFDGQRITLIPKYKDDVLHVKIGDDKQLPIYDLGDGIQAIITILFPLFLRKDKNTLVFIEEPEMHLHPRFQRKLMDALIEMDNLQYFISTHSSIFLDNEDACIYSVSKEDEYFNLQLVSLDNDKRQLLSNLGYKASDILLSNFILWVEGPSDKIYFKYWIDQFSNQELKIGKHYDIMMYHGSFKRHIDLEAFKNMSTHFWVYFDSDRTSDVSEISSDIQKIADLIEKLGMFSWVSKKRAIENYIDKSDFLKAVSSTYPDIPEEAITMEDGDFVNRKYVTNLNKAKEYKQRILLPPDIWTKIQKNSDGTTKGIPESELKLAIDNALQQSAAQHFEPKKIKVAEEVVKLNASFEDPELNDRMEALIKAIKKANHLNA